MNYKGNLHVAACTRSVLTDTATLPAQISRYHQPYFSQLTVIIFFRGNYVWRGGGGGGGGEVAMRHLKF